jgi:hypothetical protein
MFLSSEELSVHNFSKANLISAEHSAPEDFVRVIKVSRGKEENFCFVLIDLQR